MQVRGTVTHLSSQLRQQAVDDPSKVAATQLLNDPMEKYKDKTPKTNTYTLIFLGLGGAKTQAQTGSDTNLKLNNAHKTYIDHIRYIHEVLSQDREIVLDT